MVGFRGEVEGGWESVCEFVAGGQAELVLHVRLPTRVASRDHMPGSGHDVGWCVDCLICVANR